MITVKCTDKASSAVEKTYRAMQSIAREKGDENEAQMKWCEVVDRLEEMGHPVCLTTVRNHVRQLLAKGWLEKLFALSDTGAREANVFKFLHDL